MDGGEERWQAAQFFGSDKADVRAAVDKAMLLTSAPYEKLRKEYQSPCCQQEYTMAVRGTGRVADNVQWYGILSHCLHVPSPHQIELSWKEHAMYINDGYVSKREVVTAGEVFEVTCSVMMGNDQKPVFQCSWHTGEVSASEVNTAVKRLFGSIPCTDTYGGGAGPRKLRLAATREGTSMYKESGEIMYTIADRHASSANLEGLPRCYHFLEAPIFISSRTLIF